jgi:hypothetical protein
LLCFSLCPSLCCPFEVSDEREQTNDGVCNYLFHFIIYLLYSTSYYLDIYAYIYQLVSIAACGARCRWGADSLSQRASLSTGQALFEHKQIFGWNVKGIITSFFMERIIFHPSINF